MKIFATLCLLYLSMANSHGQAEVKELPFFEITKIKGTVKFNDKVLKMNDKISDNGLLKTESQSLVKIFFKNWNNSIILAPNSSMEINFQEAEKKYTLTDGACRWTTLAMETIKDAKTLESVKKGKVATNNAILGVRGTDFLVIKNALFNETEVAIIDGAVEMKNTQDPTDTISLKKLQWGGIGGRYGEKITKVIDLNKDQLAKLMQKMKGK